MTHLENLIKGLQILHFYGADSTCAEHDVLYVGSPDITEDTLNEEDAEAMENAHWFWDKSADSWAFFT